MIRQREIKINKTHQKNPHPSKKQNSKIESRQSKKKADRVRRMHVSLTYSIYSIYAKTTEAVFVHS